MSKSEDNLLPNEVIVNKIIILRGQKVLMDRDLALLYGVQTKVLNQAVRRHINRFPSDFMFQLTETEFQNWKSQIVTSNFGKMAFRKKPFVFTEQGVAMLSSVLNSERAVEVNIRIIRIFTRMREILMTQKDLLHKVEALENQVGRHDEEIQKIFEILRRLLQTPPTPRKKIGYRVSDQ